MNAWIVCDHGILLTEICNECLIEGLKVQHIVIDGECAACNQLIANMDKENKP